MKSMKLVVLAMAMSLVSVAAFAHGSKIDLTVESTSVAVKLYKEANAEHAEHIFTGVKSWPDGAKIKVRVYVNTNAKIEYACEQDHTGPVEKVVCTLL